ncbi:MAG: hypothetical protein IIA87_01185 [Nanoarchaeota archaeon]|nr:hypothetical protein [Nanoarchaeota archaeon]
MKWSPILHILTMIIGLVALLSLIGAWIAGENGRFLGFSQIHLFYDAISLFLFAILAALGTLIHQNEERRN